MQGLFWNSESFLIPDEHGLLTQWMNQFASIDDVIAFATTTQNQISTNNGRRKISSSGISQVNYPNKPKPKLNTLFWMPNGATNFSVFFGLYPSAGAGAVGEEGTLIIGDGNNTVNVNMRCLARHKITAVSNMDLLVLVDQRYFWQGKNCAVILEPELDTTQEEIDGPTGEKEYVGYAGSSNNYYGQTSYSWSSLINHLASKLNISISGTSDISSNYMLPDMNELIRRKYETIPQMLDAIAHSVGRRFVMNFNGQCALRTSEYNADANLSDNDLIAAGGKYSNDSNIPIYVTVTFPRMSQWHPYNDGDVYPLGNPQESGADAITVRSTCYARWNDKTDDYGTPPDNQDDLQNLQQIIEDNYLSWLTEEAYDVTYYGVKSWTCTGYDWLIEYSFCTQIPNDEFQIPIQKQYGAKADNQINLNFYSFQTRCISLPGNCSTYNNLSQQSKTTVLDSFQWGKALESAPADPGSPVDPDAQSTKAVDFEIYQLNMDEKDINTQVKIKAFSVMPGKTAPAGQKALLFWNQNRRCWHFSMTQEEVAIVQIDGKNPDQSNKNTDCVWSGKIVKEVDNTIGFCAGKNYELDKTCWIADMRVNVPKTLTAGERYLGYLAGSFSTTGDSPGDESEDRPLYIIRSDSGGLIPFELVEDLNINNNGTTTTSEAVILNYNKTTDSWEPSESQIKVTSFTQAFQGYGKNSQSRGCRGYCIKSSQSSEVDGDIYQIVYMESPARFVRFQLVGAMSPNNPYTAANIVKYSDGLRQRQTANILNFANANPLGNSNLYQWYAPIGSNGYAIWDDRDKIYRCIYVEKRPQFINGKLIDNINSSGYARCSINTFWGMESGMTPNSQYINVYDNNSPTVFKGKRGDQYMASYDAANDRYVFNWVQCTSGGEVTPTPKA